MKALMRQGAALLVLLTATAILPSHSAAQDSGDTSRKVLVKTVPVYPALARSMNIHGIVKLEAVVAPNGTVKSVDVKGGHPLLTQSAVTAIGHWKFEAGPKETKEMIEIKFN
jgi:TonB family protein